MDVLNGNMRASKPSLAQIKAIVKFIQQHPELAYLQRRAGMNHGRIKKLWMELATIANSKNGTTKTTSGWIKFWADKRRNTFIKQKQIREGKIEGNLYPLEQTIIDLCSKATSSTSTSKAPKKPAKIKLEKVTCNDDDDFDGSDDEFLSKSRESRENNDNDNDDNGNDDNGNDDNNDDDDDDLKKIFSKNYDERQLNIMEKLVDVMGQQANALTQMAQAQQNHSKSLERLAEASHIQALAVDRLASTFETISSSVHDLRNALLSIDYTMKTTCPPSSSQLRPNTNMFN